MNHVDLVENRWSAGCQERVGTVREEGGHVEVSADDHYRSIVLGAMLELGELAKRFQGDYFFATEVHDEDACPFTHGDRLPFQRR